MEINQSLLPVNTSSKLYVPTAVLLQSFQYWMLKSYFSLIFQMFVDEKIIEGGTEIDI